MDQPMGNACVRQEPQEAPSPIYTPSGLDVCREVTIGRQKTNKFKLASEHVGHASMGAASVLDGVPVHEDSGGVCLLIIDPQGDFHEGGSLAVAGATADSERIAALLLRHAEQIDRVVVTLDTHHTMHIAHAAFWKDAAGASPAPHTAITHADVKAGKWLPRQQELAGWALKYTESLEEGGRFTHYIWPTHCLLGSAGHAVSPALMPALNTWSQQRERSITWVLKGQNNRTEMYSALKAEVPVMDDPATRLNIDLIATLQHHTQVVVCGEAKSHCVNFTLRDLLSAWPAARVGDLVLLDDACTSVAAFEANPNTNTRTNTNINTNTDTDTNTYQVPGFEASAEEFEKDMRAAGVQVVSTAEFTPTK